MHIKKRWKSQRNQRIEKRDIGVACGKREVLMETAKGSSILKHETSPLSDKSSPERQRLFFFLLSSFLYNV
ncbi:hypothetical protein AtNW77_Chr2g0240901 [Arabidopsis thaliana]|uniref:Uncharacterized protein n=2 Tax=Arabidopsis TaxID=3701 RepID=B3H5D6_ARATH|nr:uncharacterized protein AT2G22426 [Arabidopsis thaliana]AEC07304.1 hypothetical protein AT2G22426 [Arabidopsis thaliana]KAG7637058.1 hypothetical protein ISN45_At02g016290 [Arabidopsis thaliana x Arabidopsis arenosa]|eukprot:NP_001118362.1 hypothetical protein AT2G22426 [Arabidopsis thaliana]